MKKRDIRQVSDRNAKYKPWKAMIPVQVPPDAQTNGVVAVFQNHLVTVFVKETTSPGFFDKDGKPSKVAHLIISWSDPTRHDEIPYRFKQKVKEELCTDFSDGVEIFPARWREQDLKNTHLWVLFPGTVLPLGLVPRDIDGSVAESVGGQENMLTQEDIEVYVVKYPVDTPDEEIGGMVIEVFADEAECKSAYGDNPLPAHAEAGVTMIGDVPQESPGVAWSDKAKMKMANIVTKARVVEMPQEPPTLFYHHESIEDEIYPDVDDENEPMGLEENLALAGAMREAMENRRKETAERVDNVSRIITTANESLDAAKIAADKPRIIIPR
ncbi:MAG: hypothetical protein PHI12_10830 [Dehalococcoidales bacterium]|nr:hypothetical protein [Dehalococcoidales bacterium]